jgi:hypothetical protein
VSEITLTELERPSRSKSAGPCWIAAIVGAERYYATPSGRSVEASGTVEIRARVVMRRATRVTDEHRTWYVRVTGDPSDTVELSLGSPQCVTARVMGVLLQEVDG